MADVAVNLGQLDNVVSDLNAIITEFENATSLSEALEADIGKPFDRDSLQDHARDFEERWDDKRGQLKEGLEGVRDHVKEVIKGFRDWDTDTAIALTSEE